MSVDRGSFADWFGFAEVVDAPEPDGPPTLTLGVGPLRPQGGRPNKDDAREQEQLALRREQVELLELSNVPQRKIAEVLKVAQSTINADVAAIRKARRERMGTLDLAMQRQIELERLELQREWLTPSAQQGDVGANRVLVRVSESKRRLLGLDSPIRVEHSVDPLAELLATINPDDLTKMLERKPGEIVETTGVEHDS